MENFDLIYVDVKGYPVKVWQPVKAVRVHENCYRILESSSDPEHGYWQFSYNDVVRCEKSYFSEDESGLIAFAICEHNN